jgi:hypothetical protein
MLANITVMYRRPETFTTSTITAFDWCGKRGEKKKENFYGVNKRIVIVT